MNRSIILMILTINCLSFGVSALSIGDKAPDFTLTTTTDSSYTLSKNLGQVTVLYFFGCG